MKYWPTRVDEKCKKDPSLGVAHGCFGNIIQNMLGLGNFDYKAKIGPDFVIEENDHETYRRQYLTNNTKDAIDVIYKEVLRREKKEMGVDEIVLNRSGLWSVASTEMWKMEDTITEKLYDTRKKVRKKEKGKIPVKKVSFKIQSPDRDEEVQKLIKEIPTL